MVREEFIKEIESISPEKLVYVDESGVDNNMTVENTVGRKKVSVAMPRNLGLQVIEEILLQATIA